MQQTAIDVVQGVLFYLALLLPFAYFVERLLFGFFDLKRQLGVAALIFLVIFMCFRYVHPAFDITMNPVIVLLAFIMLALSVIVIALISGKFEEQLKQMNQTSAASTRPTSAASPSRWPRSTWASRICAGARRAPS